MLPLLGNRYGDAVDFWNRYEEDTANAAAMGVNTFRLGVEWARIAPVEGHYDDAALRHYDQITDSIGAYVVTPADEGGFLHSGAVESFGRVADCITERRTGGDTMWVTFNEPLGFSEHEMAIGRWGVPRDRL